jgi:hypothetical protein
MWKKLLISHPNPTAVASLVNVVNSPCGRDRAKGFCKFAEIPSDLLKAQTHQRLLFHPHSVAEEPCYFSLSQ